MDQGKNTSSDNVASLLPITTQILDIKVFRKDDEPNAKPITLQDLRQLEMRLISENHLSVYLTPEELKHRQSLMEGESMKKHREKEKTFNDKIMLAKEEIPYYAPPFLKTTFIEEGQASIEKDEHTNRTNITLGCFYSKINEIPDDPLMAGILNNQASLDPVKVIAFERTSREEFREISKFASKRMSNIEAEQKEKPKPIKGILKRSIQEISRLKQKEMEEKYRRDHDGKGLDPNFLKVINDISLNKNVYSMQKVEELLRPYKANGMLEQYVRRMQEAQTKASTAQPVPSQSLDFNVMKPAIMPMMPFRNDKYKTVPCKYFHSPLGCQKKDDCTFIHDQTCPGLPTRNMHKYVKEPLPTNVFVPKPGMPMQPRMYPMPMGMPPMPSGPLNIMNGNTTAMPQPGSMPGGNGFMYGNNYMMGIMPPPNAAAQPMMSNFMPPPPPPVNTSTPARK